MAIDVQVGIPRFFTGLGLTLLTIASFTLFRNSDGGEISLSWLTFISGIVAIALAFVVGMPVWSELDLPRQQLVESG